MKNFKQVNVHTESRTVGKFFCPAVSSADAFLVGFSVSVGFSSSVLFEMGRTSNNCI